MEVIYSSKTLVNIYKNSVTNQKTTFHKVEVVIKPEGKGLFGKFTSGLEDNVKMYLREIGC
jgi:hypothetical protein